MVCYGMDKVDNTCNGRRSTEDIGHVHTERPPLSYIKQHDTPSARRAGPSATTDGPPT